MPKLSLHPFQNYLLFFANGTPKAATPPYLHGTHGARGRLGDSGSDAQPGFVNKEEERRRIACEVLKASITEIEQLRAMRQFLKRD